MQIYNIFKLEFNDDIKYINILNLLKQQGDFFIINKCYYLSTINNKSKLMKIFNNNIKFIIQIDKNNYLKINNMSCQNWCRDILLKNEQMLFEQSHQEYLRKINKDLDYLLKLKKEGKLKEYLDKHVIKRGEKLDVSEKSIKCTKKTE